MQNKPATNQKPHSSVSPRAQSPIEVGGSQNGQSPSTIGEHLNSTLNFIADSFFSTGNASSSTPSEQSNDSSSSSSNTGSFAEALRQEQEKNTELSGNLNKQKLKAHKDQMDMKEIFSMEKMKTEESIRQIKEQLNTLMLEIKALGQNVNSSVQTAIFQDEVEPGVGQQHFLQKLLSHLARLVRDAKNANNWLQEYHGKKSKSVYQQNSQKYGSQYQFGQEGQGLTRQSG